MWNNFRKYFHGDVFGRLWPAARAYRHDEYQHHMTIVFNASDKVFPYLRDHHNLRWMRCMFNTDIKCDYINNNLAECFNNWVRDIKGLPIVQLADKIREMIMELFRKRRMIGERFAGIIIPFVIHQLNARTRGLGHLKAKPSTDSTGEVRNDHKEDERHVVKTLTHECTCLQWQHTSKPCDHALAFINVLQARHFVNMENYVNEYYSVSRFRAAYAGVIEPLTDKSQWPHVDTDFVLRGPLPTGKKKGAGRTRKQRMKSWWEGGSRKRSLNKCKRCGEIGHREAGYPRNGTKKRKSRGKRNPSPWFDVSVSNAVPPSTPTKSKNAATTSSPGPVTRSQAQAASSPGPVTRSQATRSPGPAATPLKSPAKGKKKKMTPKKRKLSEV